MSARSNVLIRLSCVISLLLVTLTGTYLAVKIVAAGHRYHTSLTRIDYNSRENTAEISIQLFTHDLITVLETRQGKRIDLEKTPEINKMIVSYLEANLILRDAAGRPAQLRWIGKETSVDITWLYLEIPVTNGLEGKTLQNTIFFETFPEQTNLVICKYEDKKADLLFKIGEKIKEIQGLGGETQPQGKF
jgi:hypothetical protein